MPAVLSPELTGHWVDHPRGAASISLSANMFQVAGTETLQWHVLVCGLSARSVPH
jgi:hypothetical protein